MWVAGDGHPAPVCSANVTGDGHPAPVCWASISDRWLSPTWEHFTGRGLRPPSLPLNAQSATDFTWLLFSTFVDFLFVKKKRSTSCCVSQAFLKYSTLLLQPPKCWRDIAAQRLVGFWMLVFLKSKWIYISFWFSSYKVSRYFQLSSFSSPSPVHCGRPQCFLSYLTGKDLCV